MATVEQAAMNEPETVEDWIRSGALEAELSVPDVAEEVGIRLDRLYELMYWGGQMNAGEREALSELLGAPPDGVVDG